MSRYYKTAVYKLILSTVCFVLQKPFSLSHKGSPTSYVHVVLLFGPFCQVTFVITSRLDKQIHLHIKTRISNGGQWPDGNLRFPWVNHNEMVYPDITTSNIKTPQVFLQWLTLAKIYLGCVREHKASPKIGRFIPVMILKLCCFCDLHRMSNLHTVHLHSAPSDIMTSIHCIHTFISM